MNRPDLDTPEGHKAYRHELRAVARGRRLAGMLLIILGALALVFAQVAGPDAETTVRIVGFAAMLVGWLFIAAAIRRRSSYHANRAGDE